MNLKQSHVISRSSKNIEEIVYSYQPRTFTPEQSSSAANYIREKRKRQSDFHISDLVAQQTGIAEAQKVELEKKVEEEALIRLKAIEEKAYKEAFELGVIEGTEKAFVENNDMFTAKLEQIDRMLESIENATSQIWAERESEILKLITAIASKIATFEVQSLPAHLIETIEKLFMGIQTDQRVVLKVSEDDALFIETLRGKLDRSVEFLKNVKIEPEESITDGGCIIESNYGAIDATIEQRVERVWDSVVEKLPRISERRIELVPDESPDVTNANELSDEDESIYPTGSED